VDALKGAVFRSLPPILILSLSRFTYDVERVRFSLFLIFLFLISYILYIIYLY
jgi:ammonia channel protein AmtB